MLKVIPRLEIMTNIVANATNISSLAAKNFCVVATIVTIFLCVDNQ